MKKVTLYQKVDSKDYEKMKQLKIQNRYQFVRKAVRDLLFNMRKYTPIYYTAEMEKMELITEKDIEEAEDHLRREYFDVMDGLYGALLEEQQELEKAYQTAKSTPESKIILEEMQKVEQEE